MEAPMRMLQKVQLAVKGVDGLFGGVVGVVLLLAVVVEVVGAEVDDNEEEVEVMLQSVVVDSEEGEMRMLLKQSLGFQENVPVVGELVVDLEGSV